MAKKTKKKAAPAGGGSTILAIKRPFPPSTEQPVVADVTPSPSPAATKTERVELAIRADVEQLKATGEKITQEASANRKGYTRGQISRLRKLLILLKEGTISKMSAPESPPDPPPKKIALLIRWG